MDITSPKLLKIKAALFVLIGILSAGLLLFLTYPIFSWTIAVLFLVCIWAFCRAYYFCFYVMQHYAEPGFRYTGLSDLILHLAGLKKKKRT